MSILKLPQPSLDVIEAYWNLKVAENKYVRCPYFRNPSSGQNRWGLTVYAGKGSPSEIEEELKIIEKLESVDFSQMHGDEIRDIMKKRKLGVECSGFIVRVLDAYTREVYKKPIYQLINFQRGGMGWLFCKLRPYTHIDISTLAHPSNSFEIFDLNAVLPGDIIRFNSEIDHGIIVTEVEKSDTGNIIRIGYAHSVLEDSREGVKIGDIRVVSGEQDISKHKWIEIPNTGHTIIEKGHTKIYRLRMMK